MLRECVDCGRLTAGGCDSCYELNQRSLFEEGVMTSLCALCTHGGQHRPNDSLARCCPCFIKMIDGRWPDDAFKRMRWRVEPPMKHMGAKVMPAHTIQKKVRLKHKQNVKLAAPHSDSD